MNRLAMFLAATALLGVDLPPRRPSASAPDPVPTPPPLAPPAPPAPPRVVEAVLVEAPRGARKGKRYTRAERKALRKRGKL